MDELEKKIFNLICSELRNPQKGELTLQGVISVLDNMIKHLSKLALRRHAKDFLDK